jgi:hypothetical protein
MECCGTGGDFRTLPGGSILFFFLFFNFQSEQRKKKKERKQNKERKGSPASPPIKAMMSNVRNTSLSIFSRFFPNARVAGKMKQEKKKNSSPLLAVRLWDCWY